MSAITIENVSKKYGTQTALNNISLTIEKGELFGLLGPDGAGKTTLIKILVTLLQQDYGKVQILGLDNKAEKRAIRDKIGYMPGKFSLYQDLSIEENLEFFASAFGTTIAENYALIRDIYEQIAPFKDRRAGALSGGMKQKLALSCALIHRPDVLFLDEPTTGVDAVSRKEFWQMLKEICKQGITIFVSTPYMDEAEQCQRVALIQEGGILAVDTPDRVAARFPFPLYSIQAQDKYLALKALEEWSAISYCYPFGEVIHVASEQDIHTEDVEKYLQLKNCVATVRIIPPSIEDTFMILMSEGVHNV